MLPLAEYRDRQQRLRAAMAERGVDAVYLSFTPNLDYVAGLATRRRAVSASDLACAGRFQWQELRQELEERRRFRRDPEAYLKALENRLNQSGLPA